MKKYLLFALTLLMAVSMQAESFDPHGSDVLSVYDAITPVRGQAGATSDYCYVRGVIHEDYSPLMEGVLEEGGTITFSLYGEEGGNLTVEHLLGLNNVPFVSAEQLHHYDTLYIYGKVHNLYGYYGYQLIDCHLVYQSLHMLPMASASSMYDFNGNGTKQAIYETDLALNIANAYIEDVNSDGIPDITDANARFLLMSNDTAYDRIDEAFAVTNMDLNRDGRMDYLVLTRYVQLSNRAYAYYGDVAYQLADGTARVEPMQVMTWDEFVSQMTPEELDMYNNPQNYSLGEVSRFSYSATLGGWSLARVPQRNAPAPKNAPGIGHTINAPTKAVDLNGDGLVDLIDENNGIIYTNMDKGKWVWSMTNGIVIPADLNNDGIMDFVFPGAKLYVAIYNRTTAQFDITTLFQNMAVDDIVYCYDFDHDGDLDLLATFAASKNNTGYAYTCFFRNNGDGTFTRKAEQDYGENVDLTFKALQDIDGDGWYDLLALLKTGDMQYSLVWLKGNNNLTFGNPQVLGAIDAAMSDGSFFSFPNIFNIICNAEDLNGDGTLEIWLSGISDTYEPTIYSITGAIANTRPTAPAAPVLAYNNGILTITWADGADAETQTADLTYALRIGTSAGGNDILAAHANANGIRRNFLDGNMGKFHSYTIDLRSYAPATIYVAVQTLDAQHSGSVWSQEATVIHDLVPVEFTLSKTSIAFNETVELTYSALPEGYTHQWTIEDGSYVASAESATKLILSFTTSGNKTITHTVITPTGGTLTASATMNVLPAGVGEMIALTSNQMRILFNALADYNYDGRMDGFSYTDNTVQLGTDNGNIFRKAPGVWNTNINAGSRPIWYDWNLDGHVDLIFRNAWLAHDPEGFSLTEIAYTTDVQDCYDAHIRPEEEIRSFYADIDNNGYLDSVALVLNPTGGTDRYGDEVYGVYVWYYEADSVIADGFLIPNVGNAGCTITDCYLTPSEHCIAIQRPSEEDQLLYPIVAPVDERPAAPTNIQATMTNEGLLITWETAVDDHTPAAAMRYNLSVKQQGADTYLISPQNGGEADASYIPGYDYFEGTSYLIPTSKLSNGTYEIAMQALDLQSKLSVFSQAITAAVVRNPIEVQSFACAYDEVVVTYHGAETSGTPVWNFDGGIVEGSGFGPYTVIWSTGGEKTITLTLDGTNYSANITIDDPSTLAVALPTVLYEEIPASASVPDGIEYQWLVSVDGGDIHPVDQYGIILNLDEHNNPYISTVVSYDYRLSASGLNVTAHYKGNASNKTLVGHDVVLYLRVTNANGCETKFMSNVTVMAATNIPALTLVTTDANGHNVLSWTGAESFATVNVYKEGASLNDFQLIGSANASVGTYTDNASDATQKAERYRLTGVTASGNESPTSAIHKTVHLTINRGVQNGTYNLIWNEYAGASISSYRILRGASPTNLSQIAVVASSTTSYTDQTPDDDLPYYAIEYVLSGAAAAPAVNHAAQANLSGRSNVVDRRTTEGLEEVIATGEYINGTKILINGTIYILRGEKIYTLTGQEVR